MIYVTAIRMATGGSIHEHIASVAWQNPPDSQTGTSTRAEMVEWIRAKNGDARVRDSKGDVRVGVVDGTPPYIRTYADGRWTDNLLALPRY